MPVNRRLRAQALSLLAIALPLLSGPVLPPASTPAAAMSGYQWKKRPLLVFAPTADAAPLARQRAIVASLRPAFIDRKIVVVTIAGDRVGADLGSGPGLDAAALRARYGVGRDDFRAILVGLDGSVKLSSATPIPAATIFSTIDAMPIRRREP